MRLLPGPGWSRTAVQRSTVLARLLLNDRTPEKLAMPLACPVP